MDAENDMQRLEEGITQRQRDNDSGRVTTKLLEDRLGNPDENQADSGDSTPGSIGSNGSVVEAELDLETVSCIRGDVEILPTDEKLSNQERKMSLHDLEILVVRLNSDIQRQRHKRKVEGALAAKRKAALEVENARLIEMVASCEKDLAAFRKLAEETNQEFVALKDIYQASGTRSLNQIKTFRALKDQYRVLEEEKTQMNVAHEKHIAQLSKQVQRRRSEAIRYEKELEGFAAKVLSAQESQLAQLRCLRDENLSLIRERDSMRVDQNELRRAHAELLHQIQDNNPEALALLCRSQQERLHRLTSRNLEQQESWYLQRFRNGLLDMASGAEAAARSNHAASVVFPSAGSNTQAETGGGSPSVTQQVGLRPKRSNDRIRAF